RTGWKPVPPRSIDLDRAEYSDHTHRLEAGATQKIWLHLPKSRRRPEFTPRLCSDGEIRKV
ncbi:MAG: hypothetical protein ACRDD1_05080, partial [Planctomycetia bacterium]